MSSLAAERSRLDEVLGDLIEALEAHELWTPPKPNPSLYWVWDYIKRSRYMLSEFENIQHGRPLQYSGQFRPAPGTGDAAALAVFHDVCNRSVMAELLVNDTSGKTAMLTMNPGPPVDFGIRCKEAVATLVQVSKEVCNDKA